MSDLILSNEGAPNFAKPDKLAFQPPSNAQNIRQQIYSILSKFPDSTIRLSEIRKWVKKPYSAVYNAAKALVIKGFATRVNEFEEIIHPTDPTKNKTKLIISLKYVEPWKAKGKKKW